MTRSHTLNMGVSTVLGCSTGKVLDTGSLSKHVKAVFHEKWSDDARRNTEKQIRWFKE